MKVEISEKGMMLGDTVGGDTFIMDGDIWLCTDEHGNNKILCVELGDGAINWLPEAKPVILRKVKVVQDD